MNVPLPCKNGGGALPVVRSPGIVPGATLADIVALTRQFMDATDAFNAADLASDALDAAVAGMTSDQDVARLLVNGARVAKASFSGAKASAESRALKTLPRDVEMAKEWIRLRRRYAYSDQTDTALMTLVGRMPQFNLRSSAARNAILRGRGHLDLYSSADAAH